MSINETRSAAKITDYTVEHIDFGVSDSKGRAIGAMIHTMTYTLTACPTDYKGSFMLRAPGVYAAAAVHPTRNGRAFAASQPRNLFESAEKRDAHIAKRVAEHKARAHGTK
jgi:hypothetical protein